jgi:broad specificity phosphatase PhoE
MSAVLTLVRHGETLANVDRVWHGSIDTRLTELGMRQAERVAAHLGERCRDAAALYSSDLRRAHDTARVIGTALDLPVRLDADLREYDLGSWEGKTYRELYERHRLWDHMREDPEFAPHGGETPRQVASRLSGALGRIAREHRGERVIVVSHGGALTMALGALLDGDYTTWRRVVANCAVSELVVEPEPALLCFNRTDHLDGLA